MQSSSGLIWLEPGSLAQCQGRAWVELSSITEANLLQIYLEFTPDFPYVQSLDN
jgi:hypothetical protein